VRIWIGLIWLRTESSGKLCEDCNETSGSIKAGTFMKT
jgi:hypothetical protein